MAAEEAGLLLLLLLPGKDERKERTAEESYPVAGGRWKYTYTLYSFAKALCDSSFVVNHQLCMYLINARAISSMGETTRRSLPFVSGGIVVVVVVYLLLYLSVR